jgi:folate-binding protein YgfZ
MAATDTLRAEYEALTEGCGLVDRSERGKLALSGSGAVEFLGGQVTNELTDLRPGEGRYAAFLTNKGKMLGDLRILAVGADPDGPPNELLLDTERVALQALFDMIRRYKIGYEVELHKRTLECGLFSLIGPEADVFVADHISAIWGPKRTLDTEPVWGRKRTHDTEWSPTGADALPPIEHTHALAEIGGAPARLIVTADGVDVLFETIYIGAVRTAILDAGATPVSEAAAEIVRVERGWPRYGVDIDESTIPQEAGLNERAVSFTKGCYVGQETVARLYYRGKPNRHLRGLRLIETARSLDKPAPPTKEPAPPTKEPAPPTKEPAPPVSSGDELRLGERTVGHLGSVVHSPRLGTIGLALVRREAAPGDTIAVGEHGALAELCELPFAPPS